MCILLGSVCVFTRSMYTCVFLCVTLLRLVYELREILLLC